MKKVMVIGGGPAGLEAALVAAKRGHLQLAGGGVATNVMKIPGLICIGLIRTQPVSDILAGVLRFMTNMDCSAPAVFVCSQENMLTNIFMCNKIITHKTLLFERRTKWETSQSSCL